MKIDIPGISEKSAKHAYFVNPKFELVVHHQNWRFQSCWYIFEKQGLAMARVTVYSEDPKTAIISDLYVDEDFRKKGLGEYILDFIISGLREDGFRMEIETSNPIVKQMLMKKEFDIDERQIFIGE